MVCRIDDSLLELLLFETPDEQLYADSSSDKTKECSAYRGCGW